MMATKIPHLNVPYSGLVLNSPVRINSNKDSFTNNESFKLNYHDFNYKPTAGRETPKPGY